MWMTEWQLNICSLHEALQNGIKNELDGLFHWNLVSPPLILNWAPTVNHSCYISPTHILWRSEETEKSLFFIPSISALLRHTSSPDNILRFPYVPDTCRGRRFREGENWENIIAFAAECFQDISPWKYEIITNIISTAILIFCFICCSQNELHFC